MGGVQPGAPDTPPSLRSRFGGGQGHPELTGRLARGSRNGPENDGKPYKTLQKQRIQVKLGDPPTRAEMAEMAGIQPQIWTLSHGGGGHGTMAGWTESKTEKVKSGKVKK